MLINQSQKFKTTYPVFNVSSIDGAKSANDQGNTPISIMSASGTWPTFARGNVRFVL
jgi:hypothetical protein